MTENDLIQPTTSPAETQCDQLHADYKALQDVYERDCLVPSLRARIAALETALAPFANWWREVPWEQLNDWDVVQPTVSATVGDFRRARSALASPQREGDRPVSPNEVPE